MKLALFVFVMVLWTNISCQPPNDPGQSVSPKPLLQEGFVNIAAEKGIHFRHQDGRSGQRYYVETVSGGGGFFDFDGDGDLDIYLLNGAKTPGSQLKTPPRNALYENRAGRFVEIGAAAGVDDAGFGMGLCVGDVDADGFLDLFITNYGQDRLYRNLGNGRFEDITQIAGIGGSKWGTGCAFADVDGDGDLDLYVANYVAFDYSRNQPCGDRATGQSSYCRPLVFRGQTDDLYINQGNGIFTEEGAQRGLAYDFNDRGFGVVFSDINGDGAPDIFVANDGTQNRLYLNDGQGFFKDISLDSGFGFNRNGIAEAGMGIGLSDINGDGRLDPFITNYAFETNTLYSQASPSHFKDQTHLSGLAEASRLPVGWGCQFLDFDNDGVLDLAIANGHVLDNVAAFDSHLSYPQKNQLFRGLGLGHFQLASQIGGQPFQQKKVSRALAVGDWNNDGRLDLLITNTNETLDLLENRMPQPGHWIGFQLKGPPENRFAIGARAVLERESQYVGTREVRSGGSMMSQDDLRLHFGLGKNQAPLVVKIIWPDQTKTQHAVQALDQYHILSHPEREEP